MATARGYILETEETNTGHISKIAVQHGKDQTEEELRLIVENGGEIIDVIVEHLKNIKQKLAEAGILYEG